MNTMAAYDRLDSARKDRDAFNKKIADTKADILEMLAARDLLGWKDAQLAHGYLSDMMDDITCAAHDAINDAINEASRPIEAAEHRDLMRDTPS